MAQVLISNLAMLKPFDVQFYVGFIHMLTEAGHNCAFWSNDTAPALNQYYLPLEWYFENEPKKYNEPSKAEVKEGLGMVEKDKWLERIWRFNNLDPNAAEKYLNFHAGVSLQVINTFQPDIFIAFNPLSPHTGIPYEICKAKGIATITLERSQFLPQTLCFDSGGLMGKSEITYKSLQQLVQPNQEKVYRIYGAEQIAKLNPANFLRNMSGVEDGALPNESDKYKVAVLGIDDRAVGVYPRKHSDNQVALPLFESSIHAADSFAAALPNATVVYKSHPSLSAPYNQLANLSGKLHITNVAPDKLVQWADVVVSAGTSVETLALSLNKPVVLCGESPFKNKGICYELNTQEDIATLVDVALKHTGALQMKQNFETFLGYCYAEYCINGLEDKHAYTLQKAITRLNSILQPVKGINNSATIEIVKRKLLFHPSIWTKIKHKLK